MIGQLSNFSLDTKKTGYSVQLTASDIFYLKADMYFGKMQLFTPREAREEYSEGMLSSVTLTNLIFLVCFDAINSK